MVLWLSNLGGTLLRLFFSSHHGVSGIHSCICSKQMVNTFLSSGRESWTRSFSDGHRVPMSNRKGKPQWSRTFLLEPDCMIHANIPIGQSRSRGQAQPKGGEIYTLFLEEMSKSHCKQATESETRYRDGRNWWPSAIYKCMVHDSHSVNAYWVDKYMSKWKISSPNLPSGISGPSYKF